MDWPVMLAIAVVLVGVLLLSGVWIAMALGVAGVAVLLIDGTSLDGLALGSIAWNSVNSFLLTAVPLFILLAELVSRSGLATRMYNGLAVWLRPVPGGLLHTAVFSGAVFAAISGSSVAGGAAVATVAAPEMKARDYSPRLLFSSLSAAGSLGQLIPPSIGMIIYGSMVQASVQQLFLAGLVPGLLLTALFSSYLGARVLLRPALAPREDFHVTPGILLRSLGSILPVGLLIALVLGSIYGGVATPTEAAALGVVGALVLSVVFGRVDRTVLREAFLGAARVTAMILFIVVGAQIFSFALVRTGVTRGVVQAVTEANPSPVLFFLLLLALYIVLGMFVEGLSIMLLTLPTLWPVVEALGYDPLLFGVLLMLFIELGQITPPLGLILFVLKGIDPQTDMGTIIRGALPVAVMIVVVIVAVQLVPELSLWLPSTAR